MADPVKVIRGFLEAQDDLAEFIRSGPADGLPGFVRDFYRARCDDYANLPSWARNLNPVGQASFGRFCKPYWDDNGWDGPVLPPPPFTGGQCYGSYNLDFSFTNQFGRQTSNQNIGGRIIGVYDTGDLGNGTRQSGIERQLTPESPITRVSLGTVSALIDPAPSIANVVRTDGPPDDCGDPPTEISPGPNPPPNPGPLPGPEPTDNPDPENPTPIIPVPPFDDPVYGPIPITGPNADGPGGAGEPGPAVGGDGLPGDGGAIGGAAGDVSGDGDGEEIDFGPPPEGRIWVGCIVDLTVDSRIGNIPGTGPQSTVWPSVRGNVALKYSTLFGSSQRINSRYTELFRPNTALIVTGCFLQVQPGGIGTVFPISALTCPENPCGEENG